MSGIKTVRIPMIDGQFLSLTGMYIPPVLEGYQVHSQPARFEPVMAHLDCPEGDSRLPAWPLLNLLGVPSDALSKLALEAIHTDLAGQSK